MNDQLKNGWRNVTAGHSGAKFTKTVRSFAEANGLSSSSRPRIPDLWHGFLQFVEAVIANHSSGVFQE